MTEIIAVRFKACGKEYYFDPNGQEYHVGDQVIVDTAKGADFGKCTKANTMVEDDQVVAPLRPVLRAATEQDVETLRRNQQREKEAFAICEEKIAEHKLDMALVRCECSFDGNKILFFFTSEGRVDFRALVRDLAATLHSRIELRQIGVRDETKLLGGLGICGRPFCCNGFLEQFHPVSIKMAKTQGLSLNPAKISGACGRLMCCLQYEQDAYEDAVKRLPKNESFVETPDGPGNVTAVDFLRETVKVRLEDMPDTVQTYAGEEINIIRNGKGRRPEDYVTPPRSELEKLRKVTPPPAVPEKPSLTGSIDAAMDRLDGDHRGSRNHRKSESKPRQPEKPKQAKAPKQEGKPPRQEGKAQKQEPKAQSKAPEGTREGKAPSRNRNHHRHHRSGGGNKGTAE